MSDEGKPVAGAEGWRWPYPEIGYLYVKGPGVEMTLERDEDFDIEHDGLGDRSEHLRIPVAVVVEMLRRNGWKVTR